MKMPWREPTLDEDFISLVAELEALKKANRKLRGVTTRPIPEKRLGEFESELRRQQQRKPIPYHLYAKLLRECVPQKLLREACGG